MSREDTSPRVPVAELYQRSVLDAMVEVARAISHDSVGRPQRYRAVSERVGGIFQGFRIHTGTDPEWPSAAQRAEIFGALFGYAIDTISADLRRAAVAYTERHGELNPDPLAERVRDAAVTLRDYLHAVDGRVVALADSETGPVFRAAVEVFRSRAVADVFSLRPAPSGNWPLDGAVSAGDDASDGAMLIEATQRALGAFDTPSSVTHHLFVLFQRVAHYGGKTIAAVSTDPAGWNDPQWVRELVSDAHGWETAWQATLSYMEEKGKGLQPRVVSRFALEDEDLTHLPTEEDSRASGTRAIPASVGSGFRPSRNTCTSGWTRVCDRPGPGQSCTYGATWYCDTGPTCTNGWTVRCDKY